MGELVAQLDSSFHADPARLTTASEQAVASLATDDANIAPEAIRLDTELGLRTTGNYFENWMGLNERWLWGSNGWYYMTPDGSLFAWTQGTTDGMQVGQLDNRFYEEPEALTTASEATSIDDVFSRIATGQISV